MKILAIETSCDETAVCIIESSNIKNKPIFNVLGNELFSQASQHAKFGGVYPNLAKREHAKSIIPLTELALKKAKLLKKNTPAQKSKIVSASFKNHLKKLLKKEIELVEKIDEFFSKYKKPKIDAIAVTSGPGLEPALWVGINTAKALATFWNLPIIPINHMEGHVLSSLLAGTKTKLLLPKVEFPVIALLISGGHTELVLMKNWLNYKVIGQTRDDAVGEAFDKVARMLELPYPGGPEISKLAKGFNRKNLKFDFPRPMINSGDFDFSFSGIKTSVLYTIKKIEKVTPSTKKEIAFVFQEAVAEVLLKKTVDASKKYKAKTVLIGGGVSANERIQELFKKEVPKQLEKTSLYIPPTNLSTDNAIMIGVSAHFRYAYYPDKILNTKIKIARLKANGTKKL